MVASGHMQTLNPPVSYCRSIEVESGQMQTHHGPLVRAAATCINSTLSTYMLCNRNVALLEHMFIMQVY
jgi:hypothetical protein